MSGPIDLFVVAGQSNALGRGDSSGSPSVTDGTAYDLTSGRIVDLEDPVGGATTGSAWPAFCNALYAETGVPVAIVNCGRGGSALVASAESGGNGNWSTTGYHFGTAINGIEVARTELELADWEPTLRGVLWSQGERDAQAGIAQAAYEAALVDLVGRFQVATYTVDLPLYVFRTGTPNTGDTPGFAAIRAAQDAVALAHADVLMAYTDCVNFAGLGWMADELHYTQDGYNDMGTDGGAFVGANLVATTHDPPDPPPPPENDTFYRATSAVLAGAGGGLYPIIPGS